MRGLPVALFVGGFALAVAAEHWFFALEHQGEFWWSHVYGFFALFGFLGCLATIWVAKALGEVWLQRKENYYHREEPHE